MKKNKTIYSFINNVVRKNTSEKDKQLIEEGRVVRKVLSEIKQLNKKEIIYRNYVR